MHGLLMPTWVALLTLAPMAHAFSKDSPAQDGEAFARAHMVAVGASDSAPSGPEAALIDAMVSGARVLALGEPPHGAHEPLVYRNRLIAYLVEHRGFTAVALESGIGETRRLGTYVIGGDGAAAQLVHRYLSWGFNEYPANVELVEWMRRWNDAHPNATIRLYGVDLSGGDAEDGFSRASLTVRDVIDYLTAAAPSSASKIAAVLREFPDRFTPEGYRSMSRRDQLRLSEAIGESGRILTRQKASMVAATSQDAYDWALRSLYDCNRLIAVFRVWPSDPTQPSANIIAVSNIRDRVMAENTLWALRREGPQGRIVLFQANGHVSTDRFSNALMRGLPPVISTGVLLRAALGGAYRVIQTSAETGIPGSSVPIGSIERTLAAAGSAPLFLDLRNVPEGSWWAQPQTLWQPGSPIMTVPRKAMGGLLFLGPLTLERQSP